MLEFNCSQCGRSTEHLNISRAAKRAKVTRQTMRDWVQRDRVSYIIRPSGRVLSCAECLLQHGGLSAKNRQER
jgi:predicted site-specific integrase-resolvase